MKHILLASNVQNYIVLALKNMFEKEDREVLLIPLDSVLLANIKEEISSIIYYVDDAEFILPSACTELKNLTIENNATLYLISDSKKKDEVLNHISDTFFEKMYERPLNASEVAKEIISFEKSHPHTKKKVLLVDDSGTMLRNMKSLLDGKYEIVMANSGAMAIKCITLNKPDLILLDYEMPICNGAMVYEMIKAEKEFADIPIIFLTGKNDKESVMRVMDLKPEGYLLKTMDPEKIQQYISEFFIKQYNGNFENM